MKRMYKKVLILLVLGAIFNPVFAAGNKNQYVSVTNAAVKAKASQFSSTVANLKYGDTVKVIKVEKGWSNISTLDGKVSGWLPNKSLTNKKLLVEVNSKKKTTANAKELALAGKGFNSSVEEVFAAGFDVDYGDVDYTEKQTIDYEANESFIKEGGLKLEEAAE